MKLTFSRAALAGASLLTLASALPAQSVLDIGARMAPQFQSYDIQYPSNTKISEFSVPVFVLMPVTGSLSLDLGTSYARSTVDQVNNGTTVHSTISGLTDTQVRANYTLGNDAVVLTAGVNLPTGQTTVKANQLLAAGLIASDFLAFPINNMGTGFGATGGIAYAKPIGDWNVGLGLSLRKSSQYDPFDASGGPVLHYQPGNEYRARGGVDHAFGTGRISLGLTYSTFGNDNLAGSIYNTGNRWLTQFGLNNTYGPGTLTFSAWNLFREAGTLADSSYLGHEDVADGALSYGVNVGSMIIEPNIEGRTWVQYGNLPVSDLVTFGLRASMTTLGFSILPSVGYSVGRLAAQDQGVNLAANITGLHASLAIRIR